MSDLNRSSPVLGDEKVLIERKGSLTSDAHTSEENIQASQFHHQPVNIWYGMRKRHDRDMEDTDKDEPDSVAENFLDSISGHRSVGMLPLGVQQPPIVLIPTGKGTTVAILDSGINKSHMAISNKISMYSSSFVGDGYDDVLGHGTQCAGLLCGSLDMIQLLGSSEVVPFEGIATDAKVMVCKVVQDGTKIVNVGAVCSAIDYIMNYNRKCPEEDRVNVISLSFGMTGFEYTLTKKIQEAIYYDIIVVCAASNSGKKTRQPITYPARLGHVLCIGACSTNGKPTDFSPVGRELDFLAQGEGIWAPTVGSERAYCITSGTSFAAPLVAGIVCQVIEDLRRLSERSSDPQVLSLMHNVWCVRELLKEMATVQGKHCDENGFGTLNPKEYFEKDDTEKMRIIRKILHQ